MSTPIGHIISSKGRVSPLFASCPGQLPVSLVLTLLDLWTLRPPPPAAPPPLTKEQITLIRGIDQLKCSENCKN